MYQHKLDTCLPCQCFWYNCFFDSFDVMIILMMIKLIIIMIILMMINIMILYICSISSFSSHITCFQEWSCKMCDGMFWCERNYECHKKVCCMNAYQCDLCGNVYHGKKSLCRHKSKHHTDDVCYFIFFVESVNYMNFSHIWCRCELRIFHDLHDIVFYYREMDMRVMKAYRCQMNHCFDDVDCNSNMVEDDDLVGILSH